MQPSEVISDVQSDETFYPAQTSEMTSEVYSSQNSTSETISENHSEFLARSENTSVVCSALFKQQQTNNSMQESLTNLKQRKSVRLSFLKQNRFRSNTGYLTYSRAMLIMTEKAFL